jgi:hypothetical protein
MQMNLTMKSTRLVLAMAGLMAVTVADAATSIKANNFPFTKDSASQTLEVRPDAFYNLTMGYKGWSHHSSWLYMTLKKGNLYTVTATADQTAQGLHPGVACWFRPKGAGLVSVDYVQDHFYNQFTSIIATNQVDEADQKKLGTIKMHFVSNGFDGDGMEYPLSYEYQQGNVVGVLDGTEGRVELSFVAQNTGVYQCVVGGINPDPGVLDLKTMYPVNVSVGGL